jgi:uncharacterized protein with FMN-binding domain
VAKPPRTTDRSSSNQRITNGLIAVSSAAILVVYSAGYARTRSASDRLNANAERRRPSLDALDSAADSRIAPPSVREVPPSEALRDPRPVTPIALDAPPVVRPASTTTLVTAPGVTPARAKTIATPTAAAVVAEPSQAATPKAARTKPLQTAPLASTGTGTAAADSTGSQAAAASPSAAAPTASATTPPAGPPPDSGVAAAPMPPPAPPRGKYAKDGTYSGWGSCRHGDLEATVVITNGRIVSATISQCLTRYPCNTWLAPLPAQVIARQGPNVDIVSGATDSTDAFYGAVYDALYKAK